MRVTSSAVRVGSLLCALSLAACSALPEPETAPSETSQHFATVDEARSALVAPEGQTSAPHVRLFIPGTYGGGTPYVDASFRVTADAYVMVVAIDLDRRIRVLYPEAPNESGFMSASSPKRLDRFFSGFGNANRGRFSFASNAVQPISQYSGPGIVLALASDRPFQFDRVADSDGDWDERALGRLVFESSVYGAERRLGEALAITGQEFNTDFANFGSRGAFGGFNTFALGSYGGLGCGGSFADDYGYTNGYGDAYGSSLGYGGFSAGLVRYQVVNGTRYVSYLIEGGCGRNYYSAWVPIGMEPTRPVRPDTARKPDSVSASRTRIAGGPAMAVPGRTARPIDGGVPTEGTVPGSAGTGRNGFRVRPTAPTAGTGTNDGLRDGTASAPRVGFRMRPVAPDGDQPARGYDRKDRPDNSGGAGAPIERQARPREQQDRQDQQRAQTEHAQQAREHAQDQQQAKAQQQERAQQHQQERAQQQQQQQDRQAQPKATAPEPSRPQPVP